LREDSLVSFPIAFPLVCVCVCAHDVGWQRNLAQSIKEFGNVCGPVETQTPVARFIFFEHTAAHGSEVSTSVPERDLCADTRAFAGAQHHPPIVNGNFFEQQHFKLAAGLRIDAAQTGGYDSRIVEDKNIAGVHIFEQVAKSAMSHAAGRAIEHEQAGLVSEGRGRLGDQFWWQIKIEVGGAHLMEGLSPQNKVSRGAFSIQRAPGVAV
jgi:hypothetical protein